MTVYDERATTMRVKWEPAPGASGYMLLYSALNASRPSREAEVRTVHDAHSLGTEGGGKGGGGKVFTL